MAVKEVKNKGLEREYHFTVGADIVQKEMDARLEKHAKTMKVPGFRPGKVPLKVVKERIGKELLGEVLEAVVNKTSGDLFKEKGFRPALQPKIEITSFDEGKDLEYKAEFEIFPEVPEIKWEKISLEAWKTTAADKEVDEGIERIVKNQKNFEPIKKSRAAKEGDTVIMDFIGSIDGVEFEGGKAEDFRIEIGSGGLIPGFEDQLVGAKKEQELTVKVTFPKHYGAAALAGKDAEFAVKVKDILEPVAAELNEELASKLGFETLEELRKAVAEQIQKGYDELTDSKLRRELFDYLDEKYGFELPEGMVKLEFDSLWNRVEQNRKDNPDAYKDKPEKKHREKMQKMAERRVRLGIILAETAREQKIQVRDEDLQRAVYSEALRYPGQERQVIEFYKKNPRALEDLKGPIIEDRTVEWVMEQIKRTEKDVKPDVLTKYFEALDKEEE
jgi:trigger factor